MKNRNRGPPEALCVSERPNTELLKNPHIGDFSFKNIFIVELHQ